MGECGMSCYDLAGILPSESQVLIFFSCVSYVEIGMHVLQVTRGSW